MDLLRAVAIVTGVGAVEHSWWPK